MKKDIVIVTGSSGRIGSNVVRKLDPHFQIVGFELLKALYAAADEELVPVDLSSDESVHQAFTHIKETYGNKIASVIHLAAYYSFDQKHSPLYEQVTVKGTERLLKALQNFEVEQFIFSSTMLVHTPCQPGHPISEASPVNPKWDYPLSKVRTEKVIHDFRDNTKTVILRIAGVYDDHCHSIPISHQIQRIYENQLESRVFSGNVHHGASFLHMDDLVDAIDLAVRKRKELPDELVLLLGEPKTLSYDELQRMISRLIRGTEFKTWRVPKWFAKIGAWVQGMIPFMPKPFIKPWMIDLADDHYELNISKAKKVLGWEPKRTLEKTLPLMIDELKRDPEKWYKINQLNYVNKPNNPRIWTFYSIALLGFWLLATPHLFSFQNVGLFASNWICGILLIVFALQRRTKAVWIWSIGGIGIWLQFTPLLFMAPNVAAYLNDTLVGAIIITLALICYPLPGLLPDSEPSIPPGWSYNPSSWPPRIVIALLAFICWMIARYLAAYQFGYIDTVWEPFFSPGTRAVLESKVSKAFPVPDAGLGALAYTFEFFSACLGGKNRWRTAPWAVLIFGILVIPVSFVSVVLIILQPLVVGTWCTLCLLTAICMLLGIPFAIGEVAATLQFLKETKGWRPRLSLMFKGGQSKKAKPDLKTPALDGSFSLLWLSALSGITIPWNLAVSVLVGILLMIAPALFSLTGAASHSDPIAGALAVVISVISMSEVIRKVRYANCLLGAWMLLQLFWLHSTAIAHLYHAIAAILLILLCLRQGPIRERSGSS